VISTAKGWLEEYEKDVEVADDWVQGFEAENIIRGLLFHLNGSLGLISLLSDRPIVTATSPTPAESPSSSSSE
jgi:hypothetical protein